MEKLFLQVLVTACVASALLLVLLFPARRWLENRYGAQTRYLVWLGLAAVLLLAPLLPRPMAPVQLEVPAYTVPLERPTQAVESVRPWAAVTAPATPQPVIPPMTQVGTPQATSPAVVPSPAVPRPAAPQTAARSMAWTELLAWAWLTVAAMLLTVQIARYLLARRKLMKASTLLEKTGKAQLRTLPGLDTPMALGLWRPVVFLPEGEVSPLAVKHELTHVKRGDLWGKAFLFLVCALYWFDPLVWYMARIAARDMEAACDAQVVSGFSSEEKRRYGELLLNAASGCKAVPLATRFGGSREQMKTRLAQLFRSGKRSRILVAVLVAAALALTSLVACQSGEETDPTATPDPGAHEAYAQVLRDFLSEGILPDGTQLSPEEREYLENNPFAMADKDGDITEKQTLPIGINTFAVADVDGDGREELIFCYESTYTASMRAFVLDHSDGAMKLQLTAFPALIFYSNGMVKELASHNQSFGTMWPYALYSYDAEADRCQWVCSVYAEDKAILENIGEGERYPADADTSGTGTVYYVTLDSQGLGPMDEAGYQAWLEERLDGATEVEVTWKPITPANIADLLGEERNEALIPLAELEEKYAISGYYPGFTFDTVSLNDRDWYRLTQNDGFYTIYVDPTETCLRAEFDDGYNTARLVRLYDLPRFLPTGQSGGKTELQVRDITGDGVDDLVVRISDGETEYCRVIDARYGKVYKPSDLPSAMLARLNGETLPVPVGTVDTLADRLMAVPENLQADVYAVPGDPHAVPGEIYASLAEYWLDRPWTNKDDTGIGFLFSVCQMSQAEYEEETRRNTGGIEFLTRLDDTYYCITYATSAQYYTVDDVEPYNIAFHSMREYALQVLLATEGMESLVLTQNVAPDMANFYSGFTLDTVKLSQDWYRLRQNDGPYTLYMDAAKYHLWVEMTDPTDDFDGKRNVHLYYPFWFPTSSMDAHQWTAFTVQDLTGDGVEDLVVRFSLGGTGGHIEAVWVVDAHRERVYALSDPNGSPIAEEILSQLTAKVLAVETENLVTNALCAVSLPGQLIQTGRCPVEPGTTMETCDDTIGGGGGFFSLEPSGDSLWAELYFTIAGARPDFYLGRMSVPVRYDATADAFLPDLSQGTLTLFEPTDLNSGGEAAPTGLIEDLKAAVDVFFSLKRDAVNGVALPAEAAGSPLDREVTARAQAMRANYAAQATYLISIETELRDFTVRWVQGAAAMVSLYEWTWVNYNGTGEDQPATDRMGWGFPHDVTLTRNANGVYEVTRDLSAEFWETNYQSELCAASDNYDWLGQGYAYTSETMGVRVEFPPEWKDYFTFEEETMVDGFLQSGRPCPVIKLASAFVLNDDPTYDTTFARICWVPKGDAVANVDGKIFVTLLASNEGAYVCEVNVIHQLDFDPNTGVGAPRPEYKEIRAIYETVQNGILDGHWWFEVLRPI